MKTGVPHRRMLPLLQRQLPRCCLRRPLRQLLRLPLHLVRRPPRMLLRPPLRRCRLHADRGHLVYTAHSTLDWDRTLPFDYSLTLMEAF